MPATDTFERGYFVDLAYDRGFESKEEMEFMGDLYDYLLTLGDNDPYELNEFLGEIETMDFKYEEDLKAFVEKVDQVMSDSDSYNFPEELKEKCKDIPAKMACRKSALNAEEAKELYRLLYLFLEGE